jgi:hypothetical protein
MVNNGASLGFLSVKQYQDLQVIHDLFRQQEEMYKNRTHHIENRIVSISQPHVRPIVRGKAGAPVEFGSKLAISVVGIMVRIERLSWDNYNEGILLIEQIKRYKERYGYYPESVHVDKIYQTRENRKFCKEHNIRITGARLGRPSKDEEINLEKKRQAKLDSNARQPVEGKFGNVKRKYGLNRIFAKRADTSECEIAVGILVMNLDTWMRLLASFLFSKLRRYYYACHTSLWNAHRRVINCIASNIPVFGTAAYRAV